MSGSYRQCGRCGKRALSIATRCPGCGHELPAPEVPAHGGVRKVTDFLSPVVILVILAGAGVLAASRLARTERATAEESSFAEVASSMGSTATADSAEAAAEPAAPASELLVARTWTNVRQARSTRAGLEAVLEPGDTVVADSLERDWYRVTFLGEVLGYAHRSTLVEP